MQNPRANFTLDRPRLPGQRFPGLGLARWILELLRIMADRLSCEGLISNPDRYHNARLYARHMRFYDPAIEARFQALSQLLKTLPLPEAAGALENGRVNVVADGTILHWEGHPQVLALSTELKGYLEGEQYRGLVEQFRRDLRFELV
jgi:hypothetical protein